MLNADGGVLYAYGCSSGVVNGGGTRLGGSSSGTNVCCSFGGVA